MHEKQLLQQLDTISVMRHLKCCAKLTFDVEGLVKNAFEKIRPFPKRHMIASKQAHYQSVLRERYRMQFKTRQALLLDDDMQDGEEQCEVDLADSLVEQALSVQSADICSKGNAWFCYGKQSYTVVFEVKCKEGIMYELPIKFDTRVLCAQAISSQIFLFGTLSRVLYAYDVESRERLWELRVHDAVLCLNFLRKEKDLTVFAGLADGNLAVIEGVSNKPINQVDILYTSINSAPVTALLITGTNLWCASANRIFVLSALTLDSVCTFMLSKNPYDVVRCMKSSEHGIWITVKGSSSIELWDPVSMTCKMKYDIKTGQYPYPQEDEEHLNMQRVTWLLPHRDVLWVGSGDGNLIIYEIVVLPLKNKSGIDTDIERSSDNDVSTSYKGKPMSLSSSNWCSVENQSQESGLSEVNDSILDDINIVPKNFQHTLSPIRGSPDGQASNHTLTCSSEFKKELKDGKQTTCMDELSPINKVYAQNQLKKLINNPSLLTKDVYANQDTCVVEDEKSQASLGDKDPMYDSTNSVRDETEDKASTCENPSCFSEEERMMNFPIETFKTSGNDSSHKNTHEKYPLCKDQQLETGFSQPINSSNNTLSNKAEELVEVSNFKSDSNPDQYYNSKNISSSATMISESQSLIPDSPETPARHYKTSQRPYVQRLNSDSMVDKANMELNARIWQYNPKVKNIKSCGVPPAEADPTKIPYFSSFRQGNVSLESLDQLNKLENKNDNIENISDASTLAKMLNMKEDKEEKTDSCIITEASHGLPFQDACHNNHNGLTEHEIKKLSDVRIKLKKSDSLESSDSAKYVYQETKHSKSTEVYHPNKKKLNKEDNSAIDPPDQIHVELKNQESFLNSEVHKKLDENSKREKTLNKKPNLRNTIPVDSSKFLEKYFADHEAKYRLEFSNYQVGLSLPLTSESSESDTNATEKNSTGSDVFNVDESNIPSIDLESLDGSYSQKADNFLETNSNFSQRSSVEIADICDLNLIAKIKISDRPIGCLLETIIDEKPLILSFCGFYGDDEPVLRWTQESSDKMWTNEPLQEICPITKVAKPRGYMKNYYQINKRASSSSHERQDSIFNQYQSLCRKLSKTF